MGARQDQFGVPLEFLQDCTLSVFDAVDGGGNGVQKTVPPTLDPRMIEDVVSGRLRAARFAILVIVPKPVGLGTAVQA
jgi:hypothetical protein